MVPIIEVDVTPAQLMAGGGRVAAPALSGGPVGDRPALAAAGPDYVAEAAEATTADDVRALWHRAQAAGHLTEGLADHFKRRAAELTPAAAPAAEESVPDAEGIYEAEVVDAPQPSGASAETPAAPPAPVDADAVWQQIVKVAGEHGLGLADLQDDFARRMGGLTADSASAAELQHYLGLITAERAA